MPNITLLLELEMQIDEAVRQEVPQADIDLLVAERDEVQRKIDETPAN